MNIKQKRRLADIAAELNNKANEVRALLDAVDEIMDEATSESLENMPESLRYNSERGTNAEAELDAVTSARDTLESAIDQIECALGEIESL